MRRRAHFELVGIAAIAVVATFLLVGAGAAWAGAGTWICVPEAAGAAVTSGGSEGACGGKTTPVELPPPSEMATLNNLLPHVKYVATGIDGKPTIRFAAANVQIVNGEGKTASVNGEGNLIIGYDESKEKEQTGSHNLVVGTEQMFTSYAGILGGEQNTITKPFASVTGGYRNTASGEHASVTGGGNNTASAFDASVNGGNYNLASEFGTSVTSGEGNVASGYEASVTGGSVNDATGFNASVSGGYKNTASGVLSSIFGGKKLKATEEFEAIP